MCSNLPWHVCNTCCRGFQFPFSVLSLYDNKNLAVSLKTILSWDWGELLHRFNTNSLEYPGTAYTQTYSHFWIHSICSLNDKPLFRRLGVQSTWTESTTSLAFNPRCNSLMYPSEAEDLTSCILVRAPRVIGNCWFGVYTTTMAKHIILTILVTYLCCIITTIGTNLVLRLSTLQSQSQIKILRPISVTYHHCNHFASMIALRNLSLYRRLVTKVKPTFFSNSFGEGGKGLDYHSQQQTSLLMVQYNWWWHTINISQRTH